MAPCHQLGVKKQTKTFLGLDLEQWCWPDGDGQGKS
jgi:hypothetical protein